MASVCAEGTWIWMARTCRVFCILWTVHHIGLSFKNFIFATVAGFILGGIYMKTSLFWGVTLGHVFSNIFFLQLSGTIYKIIVK